MAVFTATDRMQHYFWPDQNASVEDRTWAPLCNLYQQLDSFLTNALTRIDANTTVLVISDHGFGPSRPAINCLNPLFAHLGLLRYSQKGNRLKSSLLQNLLLYGRKCIPFSLQDSIARALPRLHLRAVNERVFAGIEWSDTQVFARPNDGRVFINLQEREREGIVSPKDYHPLCERVRDILLHLTDPITGHRVIRAVHRREDLYHGPFIEKAADLMIEWDYEVVQDTLCYQAEGNSVIIQSPQRNPSRKQWTGIHHSEGIFIASGPHLKQGVTLVNATLYDIAPTILYLQGQPIYRDMDGRVLTEIFTEEHLYHSPVHYQEPADAVVQAAEIVLEAEEARKVEERLRGLGYIE